MVPVVYTDTFLHRRVPGGVPNDPASYSDSDGANGLAREQRETPLRSGGKSQSNPFIMNERLNPVNHVSIQLSRKRRDHPEFRLVIRPMKIARGDFEERR